MFQLISMLTVAVWSLQVCAAAGIGAYKKHDTVDNTVLAMAQFAVPRIQQHIKSDKFFTLRSVDSAHTQLVSGTNYRLQVTLVETKCAADAGDAGLKCSAVYLPSSVTCWVLVHDVPWKGARHVTKHKCSRPSQTHAQRLHRKRGKHVKGNKLGRLAGKELKTQFRRFVHKYQKGYSGTAEYARRMRIFAENVRHASDFQRLERGSARYGVTKFSDLTVEEWRSTWLGLDLSTPRPAPDGAFRQTAVIPDAKDMPKSWDWREKGAVTAVKNQGQCGSCWAFSVTGNVEGQYFLKYNQLLSFSEQELVDCDTDDHGCQGGMPDQAYKFIEFLGGLEQESDYPYEGRNGQCRLNRTDLKVQLSGSLDMPKNEADIQKWLYANGPVSVGVNANPLMFYHGGIIDVWSFLCRASAIDHGVLLVGFGEHDYPVVNKTKPFWIVKNSWGEDWGEEGYFRLFRGSDECGIQDMASSSVVA